MENFGKHYSRWLDPRDVDERECDVKDCEDGLIYGLDANGSEVTSKCPSEVHWTPEERQQVKDDFTYDCMRDMQLEGGD